MICFSKFNMHVRCWSRIVGMYTLLDLKRLSKNAGGLSWWCEYIKTAVRYAFNSKMLSIFRDLNSGVSVPRYCLSTILLTRTNRIIVLSADECLTWTDWTVVFTRLRLSIKTWDGPECSFNESLDSSCGNIKSPWRSVITKRDDLSHFTSHVIDFLTD